MSDCPLAHHSLLDHAPETGHLDVGTAIALACLIGQSGSWIHINIKRLSNLEKLNSEMDIGR